MSHASHPSGGIQVVRFGSISWRSNPHSPPSLPAPSGRVTPLAPPTRGASPLATLLVGDGGWTNQLHYSTPLTPLHHNSIAPLRSTPNLTPSQSRSPGHLTFPLCHVRRRQPLHPPNLTATTSHHQVPPTITTPAAITHITKTSISVIAHLPPLPCRLLERGQVQLDHGLSYLN